MTVFDFVNEDEANAIERWRIPYVLCHRAVHLVSHNHSATDNSFGGRLQAQYLMDKGSKMPTYVINDEDPFSHLLRLNGFAEYYPSIKFISENGRENRMARLLESIRNRKLDGLAFVNDTLLVQTIKDISAAGIEVQKELPVIGYDNSTVLMVLEQRPASIEIRIEEIYRDAAEALIGIIEGEPRGISLVHEPRLALPSE